MKKMFITKKEIAKAERIIDKLDKINFGVRIALEAEVSLIVKAEVANDKKEAEERKCRLHGMTYMAETLGIITFEEEGILGRYFIDKYVKMVSEQKYGVA